MFTCLEVILSRSSVLMMALSSSLICLSTDTRSDELYTDTGACVQCVRDRGEGVGRRERKGVSKGAQTVTKLAGRMTFRDLEYERPLVPPPAPPSPGPGAVPPDGLQVGHGPPLVEAEAV